MAKAPAKSFTRRPMPHIRIITTSGANARVMSAACQSRDIPCGPPSAATNACAPSARQPNPTMRTTMRSMRLRVKVPKPSFVSLVCGMRPQASPRTARGESVVTESVPGGLREDAVLHRATQEIDLGGRRASDLDVLDAHPRDVLLGRGVRDAQAIGDDQIGRAHV